MKRRAAPLDIMSASESIACSEHMCNVIWAKTTQHSDSPGLQMRSFGVSLSGGQHEIAELWLINSILPAGGHLPWRQRVCGGAVHTASGDREDSLDWAHTLQLEMARPWLIRSSSICRTT